MDCLSPRKKLSSPLALDIAYDNSSIATKSSCKYLGVHLDYKLDYKPQIHQIETKLARSIGILNKLRYTLPKSTLLLLYYALIHPHFLYALPVWGSTFPSYLFKLQRLQNKAIRIISNRPLQDAITPYFHELDVLKISDLFKYEVAKVMYQHSKNILPSGFSSIFTYVSKVHDRPTRSNFQNNLYIPKFSTSRCQRSINYQGPKIWNFS